MLSTIYRHSLALLTDLYEITMAYGYWKNGRQDGEAVFHLFFRKLPFQEGRYAVAAGLAAVVDYLKELRFTPGDIDYLATLTGSDDKPLFEPDFLHYLGELRFTGDVDAVPEGEVVFPNEPLVRITAPLIQAQIIETALLNLINFPTLIATKAARICEAAGPDDSVVEFGLRRAQGIDGGITAARAAFIGGCTGTSNVLAGKLFGIPVMGTQAHSWIMAFETEPEAFHAYAEAMPNNSVFLVDTYDTLEGVRNAIAAGKWLREHGHEVGGIRLDSGDLATLSIEARKLLDEAGFPEAPIVASNDLCEHRIAELKARGARITVWGVGTRLATGHPDGALGGVYKLAALRSAGAGEWDSRVKLSEEDVKTTNPGIQQVFRVKDDAGRPVKDIIFSEPLGPPAATDANGNSQSELRGETLLQPVFRNGECVWADRDTPLTEIQARARERLQQFAPTLAQGPYPVELEARLAALKKELVSAAGNGVTA